ncbi:hypothetical protein [Bdellovibrio sp. HCB288]|uniref:hypothetical protein n=1 Tax=Bdellovibrio sp. HCB288 TaxID=3394355 RepID=UPI0039B4A3BD
MKSLWFVLVALLAVTMFHTAHAQESAPQEPPFVDESEFDSPADPLKAETDDALSIEDEILQSGGQPVPPPAPGNAPSAAPAANGQNNTVDLNQNVPEAGSSEDLLLEDEPMIAAPSSEIPEGEILLEEPSTPVKAAAPVYAEEVVSKSRSGGIEYIRHPQSAVGLVRIEKDGTYVYKTSEKKGYSTTGAFRFGMMDAPKITAADGVTSFETMYTGPQAPLLMFDYDWQPFKASRNFKIQAGIGFMMQTGKGRFTESDPTTGDPAAGDEAMEEYTFLAVPLNLGFSYRFQYMDRQILAPYVVGGGSYIPVAELRDDGNSTNFVGTPAAYGGGGLMINIGAMSKDTAYTLRTEYEIANLWATLEYRYLYSFSEDVDFSSNIISAGITLDY